MTNAANPPNSIADPSAVNAPDRPNMANHCNSSTNKNTGNEDRANNREILIIKTKPESQQSGLGEHIRYCTQLFVKGLISIPTVD